MSERHTYPSNYPPGSHWATDVGWEILDKIAVGVIPDHVRAYLCGAIAGTLVKMQGGEVVERSEDIDRSPDSRQGNQNGDGLP